MNVEYNQLDPLLRATIAPKGDVNDDTGFSPFPGEGTFSLLRYAGGWLDRVRRVGGWVGSQ